MSLPFISIGEVMEMDFGGRGQWLGWENGWQWSRISQFDPGTMPKKKRRVLTKEHEHQKTRHGLSSGVSNEQIFVFDISPISQKKKVKITLSISSLGKPRKSCLWEERGYFDTRDHVPIEMLPFIPSFLLFVSFFLCSFLPHQHRYQHNAKK